MKTNRKLFSLLFSVVSAASLVGCEKPKDASLNDCDQDFGGEGENKLRDACRHGVELGDFKIYQPTKGFLCASDVEPSMAEFRKGHDDAMDSCNTMPTPEERMACQDGVDGYSAVLATTSDYPIQDIKNITQTFDANYYNNHNAQNMYSELPDDSWFTVLIHRAYYPEYYPGFRRDQYYSTLDGKFVMPTRPAMDNGVPVESKIFGPKSAPRPYPISDYAWFGPSRPGQPGAPPPVYEVGGKKLGLKWGQETLARHSGVVRGGFGGCADDGEFDNCPPDEEVGLYPIFIGGIFHGYRGGHIGEGGHGGGGWHGGGGGHGGGGWHGGGGHGGWGG